MQKRTSKGKVTIFRVTTFVNKLWYLPAPIVKRLLKPSRNLVIGVFFFSFPWLFFRINAHRAGVKVNATTPDKMIDETIVIEN
ncbi:hypothetical protein D3C86_1854040 [compost metagenome]